jgi:hypothetical protein
VSIEQASDCRNWAGLGHLAVLAVDPVRLDATGGTRRRSVVRGNFRLFPGGYKKQQAAFEPPGSKVPGNQGVYAPVGTQFARRWSTVDADTNASRAKCQLIVRIEESR